MSKPHRATTPVPTTYKGPLPTDGREALQWFVNNYKLYIGSPRGLLVTGWVEDRQPAIDAAVINLKSRDMAPMVLVGETLYRQADYLWKESRSHSQFGRPLASKAELEMSGSDLMIIDNLLPPENARQLWYLYSHVLYPRAIAGKATVITTPLSFEEFASKGQACQDPDFRSKAINWERLLWLIDATTISLDMLKSWREQNLPPMPPMLRAEYELFTALKERGLDAVPQHILGDYVLDFALLEKDRRLNIEVDNVSTLGGVEQQRQEAKRNLVLFADGWQVLKFTTGEILANKGACADVVDEVWRSGRKRGTAGRVLTGNTVVPMPELPVEDEVQHHAITFGGGPVAIAGGAGTGKTTCLVQRVAYLIGQGINAENILVLTFHTDTQRALKKSIEALVEKQAAQRLNVFSWHDLGLRILKENLPAIRRKPPLKVETSPQKIIQRLLAKVKKEVDPAKLELSVDLDEFYISAVISMYKSHLISPKQAKEEATNYGEEIIAKIYQLLEDQLQKANKVDRDDVIAMAVTVLLDNPDVRAKYQRQYEFVFADEYQDVTVAQDMLARLIAAPQDNLFMTGDEDESIAESKNACPELFTEVSLRLPQARCYVLERNWRSHPAIVDHARQLISGLTRRRITKDYQSAWGQAPASALIGPAALNDEREEAAWVANEVQSLVDSGRNYGDIAVMFRHHVYASILEEALDQRGVRYQSSNPINNFIPDEVEDMLAFLKLVVDPDGPRARESFERACQLRVKEIDPKLSATIASFAEANNLSYLKAVEIYSEATADQSCRELEQLVRIIRTMHLEKLPPADTIALIRRTQRLNEYYRSVKVPPGLNYEPLKKLSQLEEESRAFKSTAEFVKHIANQKQTGTGMADAGVQVLPILDSKGLEYPVVFMVGMAEGIFPADTAIDMEEERRICYVGFTRAKELLYLSYPLMFSGAMLKPSHFLVDARLMIAPVQTGVPEGAAVHVAETQQPQVSPELLQQQQAAYDAAVGYSHADANAAQYAAQVQYDANAAQYAAQVQYDPNAAQYAAQVQYDPNAAQYAAQVQYDPNAAQYAAQAQYDANAAQYATQAQYDPNAAQYAAQAQYDPNAAQYAAQAQYDANAVQYAEQVQYDPNAAQYAAQAQYDPNAAQYAAQAQYDPNAAQYAAQAQYEEQLFEEAAPEIAQPTAEPMETPTSAGEQSGADQRAIFAQHFAIEEDAETEQLETVPAPPVSASTAQHNPSERSVPIEEVPSVTGEDVGAAQAERSRPGRGKKSAAAAAANSGEVVAEPAPLESHPSVAVPQPQISFVDVPSVRAAASQVPSVQPAAPETAGVQPVQSESVAAPVPEPVNLPVETPPVQTPAAQTPPVPSVGPAAGPSVVDQSAFQVYLAPENNQQRQGMPSLPKSKSAPAAEVKPEPVEAKPQPQPIQPISAREIPAIPPAKNTLKPAAASNNFMGGAKQQPDYMSSLWGDDGQTDGHAESTGSLGQAISPVVPHPVADTTYVHPAAAAVPSAPHQEQPVSQSVQAELAWAQQQQAAWAEQQQQAAWAQQQAQQQAQQASDPFQYGGDFFQQNEAAQQRIAQSAQQGGWPAENHAAQRQSQAEAQYQPQPTSAYQDDYSQQQYQQPYQQHYQQPEMTAPYQQQPYPYSGAEHIAQFEQAQQHAQVPQGDNLHPMCPQCHCNLEANARFCGECGYTLPERVPACPTCGVPLDASAKFCGECGTPLNAPVTGDDSQLSGNLMRMQDLKDKQHGWMSKVLKMLE